VMPVVSLFVTGMLSVVTTLQLFQSYFRLGEINAKSAKLIKGWGKDLKWKRSDRVLMSKYVRSCRPLRVELGSFGCYRKPNSIIIIGKLIVYTARVLLMTKTLV